MDNVNIERSTEYIQTIDCVEDMPAIAADIVKDYCAKNDIDEKDIYPTVWNLSLIHI